MSAWSGQSRRLLPRTLFWGLLAAVTLLIGNTGASAAQVVINGPPGSGRFGGSITVLPNGNIVVADPAFDIPSAADVGAVYLYSPEGTMISVVRGSRPNDLLGAYGVVVLGSGNFVVLCPTCNRGNVQNAGAVVFGSAESGVHGVVSPDNALVGSNTLDRIGSGLTFDFKPVYSLSNGNYVVVAPYWNGTRGAAIFGSGKTGARGVVSPDNALVGSQLGDHVGSSGVVALANGNYVVRSPSWDNGAVDFAGAVTFGSGTTGITGAVSPENSLVGSSDRDMVGGDINNLNDDSVIALKNGNYVVITQGWDRGEIANAGAVTFGSGVAGISGAISVFNSLVGSRAADGVGGHGVTPLSTGDYVISSWHWNLGEGATTHASGTAGLVGMIDARNSLLGGRGRVTELTGNSYVIASPEWSEARGAVTLAPLRSGVDGRISAANSLIGAAPGQAVGSRVVALANGNFVISSPGWDLGQTPDVGATTFVPTSGPVTGTLSPSESNSLIGSRTGDHQGSVVTPLSNGNYVVANPDWDHGSLVDVGAVTFGSGTRGIAGVIGPENSLVGASAGDRIGSPFNGPSGVTPLATGNYVISSPFWDRDGLQNAGAVTFASGQTGIRGVISAENSLVGSRTGDIVGTRVVALTTGNYVVGSRSWDSGPIVDAGAVTFGSGTQGISGTVSSANSLIGSSNRDELGDDYTPLALPNGFYVVRSGYWDSGAVPDAGATTLGTPDGRVTGTITESNSALGVLAGQGIAQTFDYDPDRNQLVVGQPASNRVVLHRSGLATQTVIIESSPNPSEPGQSVVFRARVTAEPNAPGDGHVRFLARTGEGCIDSTALPISPTVNEYSCRIEFATGGRKWIVAEYLGSIGYAYSGSGAAMQLVGLYADGFEAP